MAARAPAPAAKWPPPSRRRATRAPLPIAAALAALVGVQGATLPKVEVNLRNILVDGQLMYFKGINWNPVRRGGRLKDLDFRGFVEADAELMSFAGINVVRTYSPIVDMDVLDALWRRRIFVLMSVYVSAMVPISDVLKPVRAARSHPAVLMWLVGNEWNYNGLYRGWPLEVTRAIVKDAANLIRGVDNTRPIGTTFGGLPDKKTLLELGDAIDVWGINQYNDASFGNLFEDWAKLPVVKPMFISEYGADAYDSVMGRPNEAAQAEATRRFALEIVDNSTRMPGGVCIGGVVFELADELWKSGDPDVQDVTEATDNVYGSVAPDGVFNEEWWGLVNYDGTPREALSAYAFVDLPDCVPGSGAPGCRHELPPAEDLGRYRLRACGAFAACAGKFGLCCPNSSGDYDSCCDMSLLNKEAKSGEGGHAPATLVQKAVFLPPASSKASAPAGGDERQTDYVASVDREWRCDTSGFYFQFAGAKAWPVEKRKWCCQHERIACEEGGLAEKFDDSMRSLFPSIWGFPSSVVAFSAFFLPALAVILFKGATSACRWRRPDSRVAHCVGSRAAEDDAEQHGCSGDGSPCSPPLSEASPVPAGCARSVARPPPQEGDAEVMALRWSSSPPPLGPRGDTAAELVPMLADWAER
mmetsp:Transcript_111347/g.311156  ORF Transcript_111347/g.311156 Transcript_111347/m.311156 type:complete len:643 (-) Transcript_111347:41-1969(-)